MTIKNKDLIICILKTFLLMQKKANSNKKF
jgi:hypothetical protein